MSIADLTEIYHADLMKLTCSLLLFKKHVGLCNHVHVHVGGLRPSMLHLGHAVSPEYSLSLKPAVYVEIEGRGHYLRPDRRWCS